MSHRAAKWILASVIAGILPTAALAQRSLPAGPPVGIIRENFNAMGTSATAALPTGFRITGDASPNWSGGTNTTATTLAAGTSGTGVINGSSGGGAYNWANGVTGTSGDRAVGFLTSGSFLSPRSAMFALTNDTGARVTTLNVDWTYEKYRSGTRGYDCTFFVSTDGSTWTPVAAGNRSFVPDANSSTVFNPPQAYRQNVTLTGLNIAAGATYYLRWTIAGSGGSTNSQGLGIDDIEISAGGRMASDSASDAAYSGGWSNGSNGGSGFSAWSITTPTNSGTFIGNAATNGGGDGNLDGDISTPNTSTPFNQTQAFGMFANSGAEGNAVRQFTALKVGDQLRVRMDNGGIDNPGSAVGFSLRNTSGQNLFEFFFANGTGEYQVNRSGGFATIPGFGYTDGGLELVFTLTSATTYHLHAVRLADGSVFTNTGTLLSPAGGQDLEQFRFFNSNAGAGSSRDAFINVLRTVDPILPTVTSIVRQTPSGTDTNASSVVFRVTFSENLTGVATNDFTIDATGLAGAAISTVTPVSGASVWDVSVTTGGGVGTLSIDVPLAATVGDAGTNGLAAEFTAGETYNVDTVPPAVTSISRQSPLAATTNASSVTYRIIFSETVTGIDSADFDLTAVGVTGATVGTVTPVSGTTYDVQVNTGSGDGTLRLNVAGTSSFTDAFSNAYIPGFIGGELYTFERTAPTVTSVNRQTPAGSLTNASSVTYRVTFSEDVTSVDAADFALNASGVTGATVGTVTPVNASTYDVQVNTGSGDGTLRLDVPGTATITDTIGNAFVTAFTTGQIYDLDRTPPAVLAVNRNTPAAALTNASSVTYTVAFNDAVTGVDSADFALTAVGVTGATVGTVTPVNAATYNVQVNTGTGDGTLRLDVPGTATITDGATNAFVTAFTTGQSYTLDKSAPTVTSIVRQTPSGFLTNASSVTFRVTFSENVSGVAADDFSLFLVGPIGTSVGTVTPVNASTYDVQVNTGTGDGTLRLDVPGTATIADTATNAFATPYTTGEAYELDRIAPGVNQLTRETPAGALTNASLVTFRVDFNDAVTGVDSADFAVAATGSITGATVGTVTEVNPAAYTIQVNTGTGDGTLRLDVPGTATIQDLATNAFSTAFTTGQEYTIDKTAPTTSMMAFNNTQAGGTVDGEYTASDANGLASETLHYREPGGTWTAAGALSGGTFSHTPTVSGAAADGVYSFAIVAVDNAGNATATPAGLDPGALSITFNDTVNSDMARVFGADGTLEFPMTDIIDVAIGLAGVGSPTSVTVSRTTGDVSAAGLDASRLIDESLSITGALAGATATITWTYDGGNDDTLVGPLDTVFQVEGGVVTNTYPVTPGGTTLTITGVTAFSDWYAGNAVTAVPDWTLLED